MDKKGVTMQFWLVSLIIFVISAAIIFGFLAKLNIIGGIDKETCETSVRLRSTFSSEYFPAGQKYINLKCRTEKVCLYKDKKECSNLAGGNIEYVRVEDKDDINAVMADKTAECWAMMGEGKLDVFAKEITETTGKCVVCTRIDFEDSLRKEIGAVDGFVSYLRTHKIANKDISYWYYITNSVSDRVYTPKGEGIVDKIDLLFGETRAIVFSEKRRGLLAQYLTFLGGAGAGAGGGAIAGAYIGSIVPGVGTLVGAGIGFAAGLAGGAYSGYELAGTADELFGRLSGSEDIYHGIYNGPYSQDFFNQLNCKDFENLA